MNTTSPLARLQTLRDLLGKAGSFVADEARGTMANLAPAAVAARYRAVDQAKTDAADRAATAGGFNGLGQWQEWNKTQAPLPGSNPLGSLASKLAGVYQRLRKR